VPALLTSLEWQFDFWFLSLIAGSCRFVFANAAEDAKQTRPGAVGANRIGVLWALHVLAARLVPLWAREKKRIVRCCV